MSLSKTLYPLLSTGSKFKVDWDVKNPNKHIRYSVLLWISKNVNHNLSKVEHSFDKTSFEHFQGHNKTIVLEEMIEHKLYVQRVIW